MRRDSARHESKRRELLESDSLRADEVITVPRGPVVPIVFSSERAPHALITLSFHSVSHRRQVFITFLLPSALDALLYYDSQL